MKQNRMSKPSSRQSSRQNLNQGSSSTNLIGKEKEDQTVSIKPNHKYRNQISNFKVGDKLPNFKNVIGDTNYNVEKKLKEINTKYKRKDLEREKENRRENKENKENVDQFSRNELLPNMSHHNISLNAQKDESEQELPDEEHQQMLKVLDSVGMGS